MSLRDIWTMFTMHASDNLTGWMIGLVVLASFVQISPIKINPWTWLSKELQKFLGIADLRTQIEEYEVKSARTRIIRFSDELENNVWHSEEMYRLVFDDIDRYDKYCETHPKFINNRGQAAKQHVKETYSKCLREHKFTRPKEKEQEDED